MGLELDQPQQAAGEAGEFIDLLVEIRNQLRDEKLWELSDLIRDKLEELDVVLEDTPQGTIWEWK